MNYQLAHHSLRGSRPTNQDRIAVAERDNAVLLVLADGLGGHRGGELAAEILTQTLVRSFQNVRQPVISGPSAFLALGILQAHKAIVARGRASLPPVEPRTTCVMCLVQNGYAYWAHVGDSRLYHFRHNQLMRRTQDHSTIEQLRHDGLLSEEEMHNHPQKGRLLKCVGGPNKPTISLGEETLLARDDVLLLCTDGLWEAFTPRELHKYLEYATLDEAVEDMLLEAERKMKGACDNLSAICLRWQDDMPATLPLQGNTAVHVDEKTLWKNAAQVNAAIKHQEKNRDRRQKPSGSIEDEIQELEKYLKQREPKL
jgi:serine/threonine protein phosphatase PrpC